MKYFIHTLAILLLLSFTKSSQAEKYYVVFANGNVILERCKKQIKVGDILFPNDQLYFVDKTSKISCVSSKKGRFEISYNSKNKKEKSEFISLLQANVIPATTNYPLSTRSVFFDGYNPQNYFSSPQTNNRILLVLNKPIKISAAYKMDQNNFFFIQYLSNEKTITSRIDQDYKNNLIFSSKNLKNDFQSATDITLCYQYVEKDKSKSKILLKFVPVFMDYNELSSQVEIIKNTMKEKDKSAIKQEIVNHLFENYGSIGNEELHNLFEI